MSLDEEIRIMIDVAQKHGDVVGFDSVYSTMERDVMLRYNLNHAQLYAKISQYIDDDQNLGDC